MQGVALTVCLLMGCQGLRLSDASRTGGDGWLSSGGSSARTNAATEAIRPPLQVTWTYNAEAGFGPASPLVEGDYVFVSTRKGDLHAVRLSDGKRLGYVSLGKSIEGATSMQAGQLCGATAEGRRPVFCYDLRAGRTAWRAASQPVLAGVARYEGLVVAVDAEGVVTAYDIRDGVTRWQQDPPRAVTVRAAPVVTSAGIFVADTDGGLRLLASDTGRLRWGGQAAGPVFQTPAASADRIFVTTTRGQVEAIELSTGRRAWRTELPDTTVRLTAPALQGGVLVVAGTDGVVRALDAASGTTRWTAQLDAAIGAPALLAPDAVYVGTMAKGLVALDPRDGHVLWEYELRGRMKSALASAGGTLIVLSEPRYVYRFDPITPEQKP